jgi:hypothetical protein
VKKPKTTSPRVGIRTPALPVAEGHKDSPEEPSCQRGDTRRPTRTLKLRTLFGQSVQFGVSSTMRTSGLASKFFEMAHNAPYGRRRVIVDENVCEQLAAVVGSIDVPPDEEALSFETWPRERVGNLYLSVVAICHQTSPRGHLPLEGWINGLNLRGWDYLLAKFAESAKKQPDILMPEFWSTVTAGQLLSLFRDDRVGDRLSDAEGRASLLRDLGTTSTPPLTNRSRRTRGFCSAWRRFVRTVIPCGRNHSSSSRL